MAPRKSLPAASTSTPRRAAAVAAESALDTRSGRRGTKRKHGEDGTEAEVESKPIEGIDPEKELEAWQDFAAEHYEMVEQLPLELHRNFRLLKELDLGCGGQMEKLHQLLRQYIDQRIGLVRPSEEAKGDAMDLDESAADAALDQGASATAEPEPAENGENGDVIEDRLKPEGVEDARDHSEVDAGLIPVADGEGGIVAIPESAADDPAPPRNPFPPADTDVSERAEGETGVEGEAIGHQNTSLPNGKTEENILPWMLLPDIGKLAREIVRNAEEKVAVAMGAYNAIDRHIRALDSALSAQEASILLGLRPSTLPSSALDAAMHPDGIAAQEQVDDGPITIGMGGGGRRKKNRKGRKSEAAPADAQQAPEILGLEGIEAMEANADPNEPRYCVCNRVSFGVMIGCDNDDCPTEWFHLPCVGLLAEPTGKWLCPTCRPHGVGVAAAAATIGAGSDQVKVPPSGGQKGKKAVPKGARRRR